MYKDARNYNGTDRFLQDPNDIADLDRPSGGLEPRAPIKYNSRACAKYSEHGDYSITYEAQRNLDAKFYGFLAGVTPSFWGLVGLKVGSLVCGSFTCNGVWTILSAVAGQNISRAVSDYCANPFAELNKVCGRIGGQQTDTVKGNKVVVEAFATTEDGAVCEPKNYKSGNRCATFDYKNRDCSNA